MPENTAKEDAFATADAVMDQLIAIDGIETVGAMSGGAATGAIAGMSTGSSTDNTRFVYYIVLNDEGGKNQAAIRQQIADRTADLPCEVKTSSGGMADMSSLTGGGLHIDVYGNNLEDLLTASEQVMEMLSHVDGLTEISNGQEESDAEVRIVINKDKAMRELRARLLESKQEEQRSAIAADRRSQVGTGDRSERIRTYNYPQGRLTNHRIGYTSYQLANNLNGDLDDLLDALMTADQALKLADAQA